MVPPGSDIEMQALASVVTEEAGHAMVIRQDVFYVLLLYLLEWKDGAVAAGLNPRLF